MKSKKGFFTVSAVVIVKAELPKSIEILKKEGTQHKEQLELLNKLVEYSESVSNLSELVSITDFVKW